MKISLLFHSFLSSDCFTAKHSATNSNVNETWGAHTDKQFTHFDALTLVLEMNNKKNKYTAKTEIKQNISEEENKLDIITIN